MSLLLCHIPFVGWRENTDNKKKRNTVMAAEQQHLTLDDVKRLELSILDLRDRLFVRLLFETGCTTQELLALTPAAITREVYSSLSVSFSGRLRISLSPGLAMMLQHYLAAERRPRKQPVFSTSRGPLTERRIQQLIMHYGKTILGRPLTPHMFRAGYIIHQFLTNVPIPDIERQVGVSIQRYLYLYFKPLSSRDQHEPY
jgi:integrase